MQRTSQQGGGRRCLDCRSFSAEAVLAQVAWLTTHAALAWAREVAFPLHMLQGHVVVLVYTEPFSDIVRILSLRKATRHGRTQYDRFLQDRLGTG
jgi:uncharacterized DUF497 family protein